MTSYKSATGKTIETVKRPGGGSTRREINPDGSFKTTVVRVPKTGKASTTVIENQGRAEDDALRKRR